MTLRRMQWLAAVALWMLFRFSGMFLMGLLVDSCVLVLEFLWGSSEFLVGFLFGV